MKSMEKTKLWLNLLGKPTHGKCGAWIYNETGFPMKGLWSENSLRNESALKEDAFFWRRKRERYMEGQWYRDELLPAWERQDFEGKPSGARQLADKNLRASLNTACAPRQQ